MSEQIPVIPPAPLSPAEEKQWAMIAHLSVLLNLFTGFVGTFVPLIIYFLYKDRSRYTAFHSMQSFVMQAVCSFGGLLFTVVVGGIGSVIPFAAIICLPLSCVFALLPLWAIIWGVIAGVKVNNGESYRYWKIADFVETSILK